MYYKGSVKPTLEQGLVVIILELDGKVPTDLEKFPEEP